MTLKDLYLAYKESCNCGYVGSFAEYVLSVGVRLEDVDRKTEDKED